MNEDSLNHVDFPAMAASMYAAAHGDQSLWEPQRPHTKDMWVRAAKASVTFLIQLAKADATEVEPAIAGEQEPSDKPEDLTKQSEGGATDEGQDETDVKDAIAD